MFFQKYLGICAGKPVFTPRLITINDLFVELSGYRLVDKIEALYILYQKYVNLMQWPEDKRESFDEFVYWGDVLLSDFDDIDKYLVPADKLFANIKDLKDLDSGYEFLSERQITAIRQFWGNFLNNGILNAKAIDKRKPFISVWEILSELYNEFRDELKSRGLAYEGMIYREIADRISSEGCEEIISNLKSKYVQIVFVGQNALNKCEKKFCKALQKEQLADFYWDYYGEKITHKDNKSSLFMNDNVKDFPSKYQLDISFAADTKYETISVPSAVGQASVVSTLLKELASENEFVPEDTAIVLPDETLLVPVLNSIPSVIENVNVTMGMPLSGSTADSFMTAIEKLQKKCRVSGNNVSFYYRTVKDVLEHPFFIKAVGEESVRCIKEKIRSENIIFPTRDFLSAEGALYELIFRCVTAVEDIAEYQTAIIDEIQKFLTDMDREYLYQYRRQITRLADLKIEMSADTYFKLLKQIVGLVSIPFKGEPLKGLQIMGPLETRALDFKNVIILSANDGVFPKKTVSSSFIPYNLRIGFGLPTYEYQDSISAYHFYRSICRAERVVMLYDSRSEGLKNGEVSRYIQQLKYHFNVSFVNKVASYQNFSKLDDGKIVEIVKDGTVMNELETRFITMDKPKTFSASSLNSYIDCPLKYYFENVKGISEEDDVSEDVDNSLFGTIYHKVMEDIYKPFINLNVTPSDIDKLLKGNMIEKYVENAFVKDAKIKAITGKNLIIKQLIIKYVQKTLERDRQIAPFQYIGAEEPLSFPVKLANGKQVKVFGKVDRLDSLKPGTVRIVDYKTGTTSGKVNNDKVADFFIPSSKRPSISFQLYIYALLCKKSTNSPIKGSMAVEPCVYAVRDMFSDVPESYSINEKNLELFEEKLYGLINEIFDENVPFYPVPGDNCKYCRFASICKKGGN